MRSVALCRWNVLLVVPVAFSIIVFTDRSRAEDADDNTSKSSSTATTGSKPVTRLAPLVVQAPPPAARPAKKRARRAKPTATVTAAPAAPPVPAEQTGAVPGVITSTGYVTSAGRTAMKTDTPLLETPQSVSTVTRKQIEERQPQSLLEALNYTPAARVGHYGFDPRYDAFTVRGIDMTYTGVFRDGLRQVNSPNGLFRLEPYGLEAISVLRGPAASLYGASSTGGIVDLISKRPTERTFREVEVQGGSFDRKQAAFDFSGPVTANGSVLYRLTALGRDAVTTIDAVKDNRAFIAPAFTFRPTADTTFTLLTEYMDSTSGGTAAYINNYDSVGTIGATRQFGGDARYNDYNQRQGRIGYEFEHRFNDAFTLHQNVRYSGLQTNQQYYFGGSGLVRENNAGIVGDTYLVSRLHTGALEHRVLTGVDVSRLTYTSLQGYSTTVAIGVDPELTYREEQTQTLFGIYVQDQIKWDRWRFVVGGRRDWMSSEFRSGTNGGTLTPYAQDEGKFTGRAAASYILPFGLAPYVSYGTSFTPNPGAILNGTVAQPTTGEQLEAGVKYDVPGMNVSLRAAAFDLRQQNAVVYEVVNAVNQQVQLDLHNRGLEFEAVASLLSGLNLQASYAYIDAEITKLTDATVGNQLTSVPHHSASAWLDYTVQDGALRGLGLGGGFRYVGSSFGDNLNRPVIENDPRTFVDGSARYDFDAVAPQLKGLRFQLSATNLLNEVKQVCTSNYCYWDEGRKVIASLRYRW